MKKIKLFFAFLLPTLLITGCSEKDINQPQQVNDLVALPGNHRTRVEFKTPTDAVSGKIFYNKGQFQEITIDTEKPVQSILIDSLREGEQVLRVVTINSSGAISDPKGFKTMVYGEAYQESLIARNLLKLEALSSTSLKMTFDELNRDDATGVRISYMNTSGEKDSVFVRNSESTVLIKDIDLAKDYFFYTVYLPTQNCIDEFSTKHVNAKELRKMKLEKNLWLVRESSDELSGHGASQLIDNDINTYWCSQSTAMPHWVTLDMQSEKIVNGMNIVQVQNPGDNWFSKQFRLEVSKDNSHWETVIEGKLRANAYKQAVPFVKSVSGRYFKLTILDNYSPSSKTVQIAEIDLYNEEYVSGENGLMLPALTNAKAPFKGDGSDLFPAVGAGRMQKVAGWIHNKNAYITFDNAVKALSPWCAHVWGIGEVKNGIVYQTLDLLPGDYFFSIDVGASTATNAAEVYGVAAMGKELPDMSAIKSSPNTLGYEKVSEHLGSVRNIKFTVKKQGMVSVGIVYNLYSVYDTTQVPWSTINLNGFAVKLR